MSDLDNALDHLIDLIDSGVEYPNAEYTTLAIYPSVAQKDLQDAYDDAK